MRSIVKELVYELMQMRAVPYPEIVVNKAKNCLLDYFGVAIAGSKEVQKKIAGRFDPLLYEAGKIKPIGFTDRTCLENAVYLNGLSSHILELDDGVRQGALHPGAPVLSALLPVSGSYRLSTDKIIDGMIIGYEAAIRVARAIQPSHYNKGYHTTGTCGAIGAAMAIGVALDFSEEQLFDALSAALMSATGSLKVLDDVSEQKPINVANAALLGLMASKIGKMGFSGPGDAFSGKYGFFSLMTDDFDLSKMLHGKPDKYEIENVYIKPYAACRHCHIAIEAAIRFRNYYKISPEDIDRVEIIAYDYVLGKHDHSEVGSVASAKMSIPYSFAIAMINGTAGIEDFDEKFLEDRRVLGIMNRLTIVADNELSRQLPEKRPMIIKMYVNGGSYYEERVDFPKGDPENPMSREDIVDKFNLLTGYGIKPEDDFEQIIEKSRGVS